MSAQARSDQVPITESLARLRIAMRFSLWAWAAYWPGGGLMLLGGGLDAVSLVFLGVALVSFLAVLASGALRPTASRSLKQFMLERPIYLVAVLALLTVMSTALGFLANAGLLLFATVYLGSLGYAAFALLAHVRASGEGLVRLGADQLLLVFGLVGFFAALVFGDALLEVMGGGALGTPGALVAAGSILNLLYPPMVLLASRPLRERLEVKLHAPKPARVIPPVRIE